MAERPWVTPDEVRAYSDRQSVKSRDDSKLLIDISRAEMYVAKYTRNKFDDDEKYPAMPEPVKTAVILLAESYAASGAEPVEHGGNYKSGHNDDYSFTLADSENMIENLGLSYLLDEYVVEKNGTVTMRLRKL